MIPITAIALSGGIDSLVSAALLIEQGHRVVGFHFLTGYETGRSYENDRNIDSDFAAVKSYARRNMEPLAHQLNIPIHIIDLRSQFQKRVVDYFVRAYAEGKTPNPCLVCNPLIKFNKLFEEAKKLGADRIATGHYARLVRGPDAQCHLLPGVDTRKDQSYFLGRLTQKQLQRAVLPLGHQTKGQTRRIASQLGLIPASAEESQDVCFIKHGQYGDFIARQPGFTSTHGPIENIRGHQIGTHKGLHRFTIGQRRGINCPAAEPYYVVRLEPDRNCLVVGSKQDLEATGCRVGGINWIQQPPARSVKVFTRVRYRHKAAPSVLTPLDEKSATIDFDEPQSAVTPGQGAVFYRDDEVLGAGWIE